MSTKTLAPQDELVGAQIQQQVGEIVDDLMAKLPNPARLTSEDRRGIIARYSAVLEPNFIYWMTATLLAVHSEEAKPILLDNLHEEIKDSHPVMLRKFTVAAHALPTDKDALVVDEKLTKVRLFLGKLDGVKSLLTMAFFECFIQRFMGYLGDLAAADGSKELEYTNVHGVCDVAHTEGLFRAVNLEMSLSPVSDDADLFEGVKLLRSLIDTIIDGPAAKLAA